jgi:large subunit ribosomal protein L28
VNTKDLNVNDSRESTWQLVAQCAVRDRRPVFSVSHSHIRNKRTFRPNLQAVRTTVEGQNVRVRVCAKCLKAGKIQRVAA